MRRVHLKTIDGYAPVSIINEVCYYMSNLGEILSLPFSLQNLGEIKYCPTVKRYETKDDCKEFFDYFC